MNPPTTLTNNHPPAAIRCGLNQTRICREESEAPQFCRVSRSAHRCMSAIIWRYALDIASVLDEVDRPITGVVPMSQQRRLFRHRDCSDVEARELAGGGSRVRQVGTIRLLG